MIKRDTLTAAQTALNTAMAKAGVTGELILLPAMQQSDWRDYAGIGVFGDTEELVTRGVAWLRKWVERCIVGRDSDGNVQVPWTTKASQVDEYGRVDFTASVPVDQRPKQAWRALRVCDSYKISP